MSVSLIALLLAVLPTMTMTSALTSVVIPSYNRAKYLPLTVASALAQEEAEVEVIVVDDGSTDETATVVDRHKAEWGERFRYIRQPNSERCVARNRGLSEARGEFVAFLDSDDLWRPNHLRMCVSVLKEDPQAAAVYSEHGLIDAEGRVIRDHASRLRAEGDQFPRQICLKKLIVFPAEVVIRRALLESIFSGTDVFDPEAVMLEEWLVWVNLLKHAPFRRLGEPTVWRRLHPNSTWGDPEKFARQSVRATAKVIATGLPEILGIPPQRIVAINQTHCAYGFYLSGQLSIAAHHLVSAVREYPGVMREAHFWQVAMRLCFGKRLARLIRSARHHGHGKLVGAESTTKL